MKRRTATKRPKQTSNQAGLVRRFGTMLPQPSAEALAGVTARVAEVRPKSVGKSLASLVRRNPALARAVGGITEAAPYLWGAIEAKPARFLRLLDADPIKSLAAIIQKTKAAAARTRS